MLAKGLQAGGCLGISFPGGKLSRGWAKEEAKYVSVSVVKENVSTILRGRIIPSPFLTCHSRRPPPPLSRGSLLPVLLSYP